MEREPASDIITGAGSPSPRIDATSFHRKRKQRQNKRLAVLGGRERAKKSRRATIRTTNTQKQSTRPMKRPKLMMIPIAKKRPKPTSRTMPVVELKPKIKPKPRPRPRPTSVPGKDCLPSVPDEAAPLSSCLVIDLTVVPHSSYLVIDLTGV